MYYKLTSVDGADPARELYVLEITSFPPPPPKRRKKKRLDDDSQKSVKDYFDILYRQYSSIRKEDVIKGRNIFCPVHENAKTSKTPSAKLNVKSGWLTCFSSNCKIPVNEKTGYRQLPITQLLKIKK